MSKKLFCDFCNEEIINEEEAPYHLKLFNHKAMFSEIVWDLHTDCFVKIKKFILDLKDPAK